MLTYAKNQRAFVALMIIPAFAVMLAFFVWPAIYSVMISFTDLNLLGLKTGGNFVGFDNYIAILTQPEFRRVFFNTAFWLTLVTVSLRLVCGLALAVFIESETVRRLRLTVVLRLAMLLPWATPDLVSVTVWKQIFDPRTGVINQLLLHFGIVDQPIIFLADTSFVWPAITTIIFWNGLPIITLTMAAALQTVPRELLEAAEIDGANGWIRFWHVVFPHVLPTLAVLGLLATIWTFNNFVFVWLSTNAGPGNFTSVLATDVYMQGFINFKLGLSAAIGIIMALFAAIFGFIYYRYVVSRQFSGIL